MSEQAKDALPAHLNGINEKNLEQGEIQVKKHVQDVASHQHLDSIWMNKGERNFGVVKKLFEK